MTTPQPTQLTRKFGRALDYARILHGADIRKGTSIPYLAHPMAVASIVLEHGGSEDQTIAALLHDAGEDHGGRRRIAAIRSEFGPVVADIVESCSDDLPAQRHEKLDWRTRKIKYLGHLATVGAPTALVSAADKLHNARAILADHRVVGDELWKRFNPDAGRPGTLWYYRRLAEILTVELAETAPELAAEVTRTVNALVEEIPSREHGVTPELLEDELEAARAREKKWHTTGSHVE